MNLKKKINFELEPFLCVMKMLNHLIIPGPKAINMDRLNKF